jgi:peptidyl-tRNA hydrolase ICT1
VFHSVVQESRYVASRSGEIVIQADSSRKQAENVHECYKKLHQLIVEAAKDTIPGETSEGKARRVKVL